MAHYEKLCLLSERLLTRNVYFLGAQSEIKELLKFCDIYLCSSVSESSPLAVWEAMAMGKPVVSTNVGDVSLYVKDGINGFVIDAGDFVSMADRISKYIENDHLRQVHGKRARSVSIENLDIKFCAEKHIQVYYSIFSD